jgi:hypothetical protein
MLLFVSRLRIKNITMRLLILFLIISSNSFSQSPWVRDKGAGYAQIGYSSISNYSTIYDKSATNGTTRLERFISDRTVSAYGEFGLTPKWTIISSIPVKFLESGDFTSSIAPSEPINSEGDLIGLGNVELGAKYGFYNKKFVASAQLKVSANTTTYDVNTGLRTGVPAWSIEPMISVGKGGNNYFVFGYGGLGFRTNNFSHYGRLGIEGGLDINKRFWLIAFVDAVFSFRNGTVGASPANLQTGLYLNNQEFIAFGPKFIYEAIKEQLGFTLSLGGGVSNNFVPQKGSFSVGLYYKWD